MSDLITRLDALRRPPLLVEAARSGLAKYYRGAHLGRALGKQGPQKPMSPSIALGALLDIEHDLDMQRRCHDASYSYMRHVEVLIALLGEAQIVRAAMRPVAAE